MSEEHERERKAILKQREIDAIKRAGLPYLRAGMSHKAVAVELRRAVNRAKVRANILKLWEEERRQQPEPIDPAEGAARGGIFENGRPAHQSEDVGNCGSDERLQRAQIEPAKWLLKSYYRTLSDFNFCEEIVSPYHLVFCKEPEYTPRCVVLRSLAQRRGSSPFYWELTTVKFCDVRTS